MIKPDEPGSKERILWAVPLTQCQRVVDAEAAEDLPYVPCVQEAVALDDHLEGLYWAQTGGVRRRGVVHVVPQFKMCLEEQVQAQVQVYCILYTNSKKKCRHTSKITEVLTGPDSIWTKQSKW